jgi:hypothetical protein
MKQLKDGGHGLQEDMISFAINNMQMVRCPAAHTGDACCNTHAA